MTVCLLLVKISFQCMSHTEECVFVLCCVYYTHSKVILMKILLSRSSVRKNF